MSMAAGEKHTTLRVDGLLTFLVSIHRPPLGSNIFAEFRVEGWRPRSPFCILSIQHHSMKHGDIGYPLVVRREGYGRWRCRTHVPLPAGRPAIGWLFLLETLSPTARFGWLFHLMTIPRVAVVVVIGLPPIKRIHHRRCCRRRYLPILVGQVRWSQHHN